MANSVADVHVRRATLADWEQLVALDQAIFGHYGAAEDPATIRARLDLFPAGCVVLTQADAVASSPILGYLTTEKWHAVREPALDEDPHITHQPDGVILNITTLAIAPTAQNRGLGGVLVAEAIKIAKRERCTQIILETAHARSFYLRHGFMQLGERHQRDILLHIMTLSLD